MKLQDFPVGARFEYAGRIFVKTGPLTASSEQGGQCMIPRYATLKALDLPAPESRPGHRRKLDEANVRAAFNEFYQTASQLLDNPAHPELERARQAFLAKLK
ncbi:MAG: hypothetical protein H6R15_440 [Proteobacteria bacterium]|nr:hypothetical protein [Pseudomonadota bacterium]